VPFDRGAIVGSLLRSMNSAQREGPRPLVVEWRVESS
jgi:hypothetical protein